MANAIIVTSFIISDETKGECNTGNLVIPHLLVLLVTAIFLLVLFLIHFESSLTVLHLGAITSAMASYGIAVILLGFTNGFENGTDDLVYPYRCWGQALVVCAIFVLWLNFSPRLMRVSQDGFMHSLPMRRDPAEVFMVVVSLVGIFPIVAVIVSLFESSEAVATVTFLFPITFISSFLPAGMAVLLQKYWNRSRNPPDLQRELVFYLCLCVLGTITLLILFGFTVFLEDYVPVPLILGIASLLLWKFWKITGITRPLAKELLFYWLLCLFVSLTAFSVVMSVHSSCSI